MRAGARPVRFALLVISVAVLSGYLVQAQIRFSLPLFARLRGDASLSLECTEEDVLLVVAPHCDDEVFGAGGFMYEAVKRKAKVYVVVMTNGDAFRLLLRRPSRALDLGIRRQRETLEALGVLGIPKEHVFFLGYPDRGLEPLFHEHWSPDVPYLSRFTRMEFTPAASFRPGSPYCGVNVAFDLEEILRAVRPTIVLTSSPFDTHPDHRAAYNFTMYALERLRYEDPFFENTRVFWYLVHWSLWPHGSMTGAGVKLLPPRELCVPTIRWQYYFLAKDAIFAKAQAVRKYRSQSAGGYPLSFVRANELFVEARRVKIPTLAESITVDGVEEDWKGPSVSLAFPEVRVRRNGGKNSPSLTLAKDDEYLYLFLRSLPRERAVYRFHFLPVVPFSGEEVALDVSSESRAWRTVTLPEEKEGIASYAFGREGLEVAVPLHLLHHAPTVFFKMEVLDRGKIVAESIWKILTF